MTESTAIDIGKARCLLNLRSFAAAFLALAVSLGLPLGAVAQADPIWDLETLVIDDYTTYCRSSSAAGC